MPWGPSTDPIASGLEVYDRNGALVAHVDAQGHAVFASVKVRPTRVQRLLRKISPKRRKKAAGKATPESEDR